MNRKIAKWVFIGLVCVLVPCALDPETFWQRSVVMAVCAVVSVVVAKHED